MMTGSTVVRVVPSPTGGWDVREPGTARAIGHAAQQDAAVSPRTAPSAGQDAPRG